MLLKNNPIVWADAHIGPDFRKRGNVGIAPYNIKGVLTLDEYLVPTQFGEDEFY